MGNLINDYSEGIWTVKTDRITGSFQQGLWEIKPQDIQYFAETYVTDQAGRMGLQLLIKTNNIAQPYPIGVYFGTNPKMTEVIGDFAASFGISYQKAVQQAPVYQQQYQQPQPQQQHQPQTNAQLNAKLNAQPYAQAYQQPNQQPYKRKKSSVGKVIGFSFLILIIAMIAYAVFWFMGIKSIADDFAMPSNPDDAAMEIMYDDILAKAASGEATEIVLDEEESKYFTSKLNNETNFFKFDDGNNIKIDRMIMYPEDGKVKVELVIDIKSGLPIIGASNSRMSFYAAAGVPESVYGSLIGVSAVLEVRVTPEGMAFKPISVAVGNSPMPVGIAMGLVRQFVPDIDITDDGFINFEPMEVFGKNGEKLFDITGFEVRDGNLVIYTE